MVKFMARPAYKPDASSTTMMMPFIKVTTVSETMIDTTMIMILMKRQLTTIIMLKIPNV